MKQGILIFLIFLPSTLFAEGFFQREAAQERRDWELFPPEEIISQFFAEELKESEEYRLEINIPARRLFLYEENQVIKSYPVAVGSLRYKTPVGPRRGIQDITWNPWWYPPPSDWAKDAKVTPPGPSNPLGRVKMPLGGDIVLHGTNQEGSIGRPVSHGCMRMKNRDAGDLAWFFQRRFSSETDESLLEKYWKNRRQSFYVSLNQKIPVTIVYDRVTVRDKDLEVYPDIYGKQRSVEEEIFADLLSIGVPPWIVDPDKIDEIKKEKEGTNIPIAELLLFTSSGL
jgi:murein L,D-transpeptidase YcbB/YkuD